MPIKTICIVVCLISFMSSCSVNKLQQTPVSRKLKFEQAFAEQCIKKEIRNSINKDIDRLRFSKPCSCIAKRVVKGLTEREMDKFLLENKITRSVSMRFDKAAYFCVQNVTRPKARRQSEN